MKTNSVVKTTLEAVCHKGRYRDAIQQLVKWGTLVHVVASEFLRHVVLVLTTPGQLDEEGRRLFNEAASPG
ncbi:hypothetical protein HYH03_011499 [Edaphochlamys debaryana]|uniref:Uncharacterized protein n=1 Tax=Edaphochlamys debaryana TaxID=47281 RepID=A0A835XUJ4_9CHLO|nr:hypothetical protein HYH03_011499 [Edaphochlamys debaryana]|eukprot:KAG2490034.1 hypothetical protein HYH03_011499 [Edaphochlamys debaryana]